MCGGVEVKVSVGVTAGVSDNGKSEIGGVTVTEGVAVMVSVAVSGVDCIMRYAERGAICGAIGGVNGAAQTLNGKIRIPNKNRDEPRVTR